MPGKIEVPLEYAQEHIGKAHEGLHGEGEEKGKGGWTRFIAVVTARSGSSAWQPAWESCRP